MSRRNPADEDRDPYRLESSDSDDDIFPNARHFQPLAMNNIRVHPDDHVVIEGARVPQEEQAVFQNPVMDAQVDRELAAQIMGDSSDDDIPRQGPRTPPGEPAVQHRGPRTPPYEDFPPARGPRTPPDEPMTPPRHSEYQRTGPRTPPGPPPEWSHSGPRTPQDESPVAYGGPKTPQDESPIAYGGPKTPQDESPIAYGGPKTPQDESPIAYGGPKTPQDESPIAYGGPKTPEDGSPIAYGEPRTPPGSQPAWSRGGPRTPPGEPGSPRNGPRTPPLSTNKDYEDINVGFEDISDGEDTCRQRVGPKTPPEEDYVPPSPVHVARATEEVDASSPVQTQVDEAVEEDEKRPRSPHTPPPQQSNETSPENSPNASPKRSEASQVHSRKRQHDDNKPGEPVEIPKELTFPAVATQKCLSLLEFVEKRGLTITDDELLTIVRDSIILDQAMEDIANKREIMKKTVEEMTEYELESIRKIHGNLPRHMQDVLQFDGKTVHIAQERAAMPPMPFASSPLMSLKYGQSLPHHMGMPPPPGLVASQLAPPPIGLPPPPMGLPPPPSIGAPPFAVPPPLSLLGPPPFSIPPLMPPPPQSLTASSSLRDQQRESERGSIPQGLNPIAFSNAPPGLKLAPMPEYSRPPPAKKQTHQNPQMNRITNNLSSMLTNALKAQVSKSPFNSNPVTPKKAVPSLMSINIPGIPKAGPSGPK